MADLTDEEAEEYRKYAAAGRERRRDELNAGSRERYRKRQEAMTPEEREAQRRKWREANRRKAQKKREASNESQGSGTFDAG